MMEMAAISAAGYGTANWYNSADVTDNGLKPLQLNSGMSINEQANQIEAYQRLQRLTNGQQKYKGDEQEFMTRIVRIFVLDPEENLPLEKRILHKSEEKLTELTDQELWMMEVPVKEIVETHNAYRITVENKKATEKAGKPVMLEPVKIRDLRMVVVEVLKL